MPRFAAACALLVAAVVVAPTLAAAATFQLAPTDDAWTWSRQVANEDDTNFGANPELNVTGFFHVLDPWAMRTYLKFSLSGLPAGEVVTSAVLHLYQFDGGGFATGIDVNRLSDDGWSEGALTWSAAPAGGGMGTLLVANTTLGGGNRGWTTFDLLASGAWDPAADRVAGDGALTLIVKFPGLNEVGGTRSYNFCSKDAGPNECLQPGEIGPVASSRAPYLEITTVPEPGTAFLAGAGILALALRGRRPRAMGNRRGAGRW